MSSVQLHLDYLMAYWNMPRVITYPTPPYITLRMNIGFHQGPLLPRPRLFLDTIGKLSSAEGFKKSRSPGWAYGANLFEPEPLLPSSNFHWANLMRDTEEGASILHREEVYIKGDNQTSQIHDEGKKLIFYIPTYGLMALLTQNPKGTRFVITKYRQESDTDKVPVTLKINETNFYLSCSNGELILENNDENLDTIQGPTKRFLFLRTRSLNHVTFESVMSPGMYICTNISEQSPVNMSKDSDPKKIVGFTIDAEVGGIFVMVGNNRFSLRVPKETLKRLQEYKELMAEILMKGLLTDRYGILFVGRLII